jgi:hypothetical protein
MRLSLLFIRIHAIVLFWQVLFLGGEAVRLAGNTDLCVCVYIAQSVEDGWPGSIPDRGKVFSVHLSIRTDCGAH